MRCAVPDVPVRYSTEAMCDPNPNPTTNPTPKRNLPITPNKITSQEIQRLWWTTQRKQADHTLIRANWDKFAGAHPHRMPAGVLAWTTCQLPRVANLPAGGTPDIVPEVWHAMSQDMGHVSCLAASVCSPPTRTDPIAGRLSSLTNSLTHSLPHLLIDVLDPWFFVKGLMELLECRGQP